MNELHLDIGQLVIEGVSLTRAERIALKNSVEQELHTLLSGDAGATQWNNNHTRHINGANINLSASRIEPAPFGKTIARSIYTSINKAGS